MSKSIYLFVDVETTGKNFEPDGTVRENQLLQYAHIVCDEQLQQIHEPIVGVAALSEVEYDNAIDSMSEYVRNMHTSTGLLDALKTTDVVSYGVLDNQIMDTLRPYVEQGYRIIPTGNNVQFDVEAIRRYLPKTFETFHYAFFDVTSVRRAFTLAGVDTAEVIKAKKKSNHDALVDVRECIKEAKALRDAIALM